MRIFFPNVTRPKKSAKRISTLFPAIPHALALRSVAIACGYRDWHEFEMAHAATTPSPLDHDLSQVEFRSRATSICRSLAKTLGIPDGDIQAALPILRLTGDRVFTLDDHHAIRIACWRSGLMPWNGARKPGATFLMKEGNYSPVRGYWRSSEGDGVSYICDTTIDCGCATYEAVSPRTRMEDFIPLRLWLPYGWWTLEDGSDVLFSRDYMPLWKVTPNGRVERMPPSLRVSGIRQEHWFMNKHGRVTWHSGPTRQDAEARLLEHGITALPRLADALPLLIAEGTLGIGGAAKRLDGTELADVA
jgi:hypothetical protein